MATDERGLLPAETTPADPVPAAVGSWRTSAAAGAAAGTVEAAGADQLAERGQLYCTLPEEAPAAEMRLCTFKSAFPPLFYCTCLHTMYMTHVQEFASYSIYVYIHA